MSRKRRTPSAVLTDQVAGDALGEILRSGSMKELPEVRPSLRSVPLDRIAAGSDLQTRAAFDPEKDPEDAALVESIRDVGVHQPVHLVGSGDKTYTIRSGHRRVGAARLAGLSKIPAIVWPEGTDTFDSALDTWLENLHRKDLAPLERGRMLVQMLDRFQLPRSPASAQKLGLSKTSFYRYLSLLDAPPDIREALDGGSIGVMQAVKLAAVDDPELRGRLLRIATKGSSQRSDEEMDPQVDTSPNGRRRKNGPVDSSVRGGTNRAGAQEQPWAARKSLELASSLDLDPVMLAPVTKALNARQLGASAAASAALLVASGVEAEEAVDLAAPLDRQTLRAVETLFKAVCGAGTEQGNQKERLTLRRILSFLVRLLEGGEASRAV